MGSSIPNITISIKNFIYFFLVFSLIPLGFLSTEVNVDFFLLFLECGGLTLWVCIYKRDIMCKYFARILSLVWTIIDVYILENSSIYLPNLHQYSHRTGALYLLIACYVVHITSLIIFDKRHRDVADNKDMVCLSGNVRPSKTLSVVVHGLIVLALIANLYGLVEGYFAAGASSRYAYAQNASVLVSIFYNLFRLLTPVVAVYSVKTSSPKVMFAFTFLHLSFLLLIGNKFGALLSVLNIAILSYIFPFAKSDESVKIAVKKVFYALLAACVLLLSYSVFQSYLEKGSMDSAIDHIIDRVITGQGDVWWGVYSETDGELHYSELSDELQAFSASNYSQQDYNFGIYKMMNLIAPQNVVQAYSESSARLTASTEASFYYYGGSLVLIGSIFIAWITSKCTNGLISACKTTSIAGVFCMGLLYNYSIRAASMSELYLFITPTAIACYSVIVWTHITRRRAIAKV